MQKTLLALMLVAACSKKQDEAVANVGAVAKPADVKADDKAAAGSGSAINGTVQAARDHLSTFAADVDTASYTLARRYLDEGHLPDKSIVRPEEFVNYFRYQMPAGDPFGVVMDAAPSPIAKDITILRVGVGTRAKANVERKPAHLVFLVDVSGSMSSPDRLALAKRSLQILTDNLGEDDTVSIVTYAGDSRVRLEPTHDRLKILAAIDGLHTGGGTAMASGIDLAYAEAMKGLRPGTISRVIVCTDGDANIGTHDPKEMLSLIAGRAKEGVSLSTIGFGMGNYRDDMLEQLADQGNGNHFYVDGEAAAKKIFQTELGSTLEVVAKDVKLQVDFDPALVASYRLVGYEDRDVADQDFRNDRTPAGQVGAGHQVTAMYEVKLKAQAPFATLHVRWKQPDGLVAQEKAFAMEKSPAVSIANTPADFRFAFAAAAFADRLRGGNDWPMKNIRDLARDAAGDDKDREELVRLVEKAMALSGPTAMIE